MPNSTRLQKQRVKNDETKADTVLKAIKPTLITKMKHNPPAKPYFNLGMQLSQLNLIT